MKPRTLIIQYSREQEIASKYGHLLGLDEIREVLKYKTVDALKKAHYEGKLSLKLKKIEGRAGMFCTAKAVAEYIDQLDKEESENVINK